MDTLHTVHATLIDLQDTPYDRQRAIRQNNAHVYWV
jgi:hypothetical protein